MRFGGIYITQIKVLRSNDFQTADIRIEIKQSVVSDFELIMKIIS